MTVHVVVDGANVVGSRPDGWWRDRPGAARRLAEQLAVALIEEPDRLVTALGLDDELRVHLVLEGAARAAADLPTHPWLVVHRATADGDSAIVTLARELAGDGSTVIAVTADRELRDQLHATGASTVGPGRLLEVLPIPRAASTDHPEPPDRR